MKNPDATVDIRFTPDGFSASMYDEDAMLLDESWYTWDEIEDLKTYEESQITFEYYHDDES